MMLLEHLNSIWTGIDHPFLIYRGHKLRFSDIALQKSIDLSEIRKGDVVAVIGDFNPDSILTLLRLIDMRVIVVPLTKETKYEHEYFFESAFVDVVIEGGSVVRRYHNGSHNFIDELRRNRHAGLVLFSTGTTG